MVDSSIQRAFELAVRHHQAGELAEAEGIYREILAQEPTHAGAVHHLGLIALQRGDVDVAIELIAKAIALQPQYAEAHCNLGNALRGAGKLDEAAAAYREAIRLKGDFPEAFNGLGNALRERGKLDEAINAYRGAIERRAGFAEAHNNLGNALRDRGRIEEAAGAFRQAIAISPEYAEAYCNLGNALRDKGELEEALGAYARAIELAPRMPEARNNLGTALKEGGRLEEAVAAYREAIALRPDYARAHSNLGSALKDEGRVGEAIEAFRKAVAINPDFQDAHSNLLFALQFHPGFRAEEIFEEHRKWSEQCAAPLRRMDRTYSNKRDTNRRLRIGYVSGDFREHCQSLFTIPLLSHHDHERFEIYAYSGVTKEDEVTGRIRTFCDAWRSTVGLTDEEVDARVREDGIDILVDLAMHMAGGRPLVFARKPAPVQVAWLAYPGTTGMGAMDYRLTDPYLDPPGEHEGRYAEKSVRLPQTFWCYGALSDDPGAQAPPASRNGFITFGCLNNFCKISNESLAVWAAVLKAAPTSRLILLAPRGEPRRRVIERLGVDGGRVEFVELQPRDGYLRTYYRIDVCLETVPYNGHTTSLDAMWMGVPVVTLVGKTVVGRAGLSQLSNLRLGELIARTEEEYVRIVTELANDLGRLGELRRTLRGRMMGSPLCDGKRFAAGVEGAYRMMWGEWCDAATARG